MARARQILFIQGGGAGAHDEWDDKLVKSLSRELGGEYEVRYPRMPDESDPRFARWSPAIRREMADLDAGAAVAGHSIGATILVNALAEQPPDKEIGAIVLIAAPFVGEGGWPSDEFELTSDLGARLPPGARVHVFHGLQDETAPPSHADLYALAIPQAQVRRLRGRDHQLNDDLSEVAEAVRLASVHARADTAQADSGLPPSTRVSRLSGPPAAVPVCLATSDDPVKSRIRRLRRTAG
jgi:predicted alpha/beta hydrolase family esterase